MDESADESVDHKPVFTGLNEDEQSKSKKDLLKAVSNAGLAKHNEFRALHEDTPLMKIDTKLTADAQAYAERLANEWQGPGSRTIYHDSEELKRLVQAGIYDQIFPRKTRHD